MTADGPQQLTGYVVRDYDDLIAQLRSSWLRQGVTQDALAQRMRCSRPVVRAWLAADAGHGSQRLLDLADALGYDLALIPRQPSDGDAPRSPLSSTLAAQEPAARGSGCTEAPEAISAAPETVHLIFDGSATTSCCGRTPFELRHADGHRLTVNILKATCTGPDEEPDDPPADEGLFLLSEPERRAAHAEMLARVAGRRRDTGTPDVTHTRGAAEALAQVAERIANTADDFDASTLKTLRIILEATEAELGLESGRTCA